MLNSGDVVLVNFQFADTFELKKRPGVILFEEFGNIVIAGITSNLRMEGIRLTKKEGAIKDSIIKLNYIYTTNEKLIEKKLFSLSAEKKKMLYEAFDKKLMRLIH